MLTLHIVGQGKKRMVPLTDLCKLVMCVQDFHYNLGHSRGLEAGKENSTHEGAADPGARGGWMSMYETGAMLDSSIRHSATIWPSSNCNPRFKYPNIESK